MGFLGFSAQTHFVYQLLHVLLYCCTSWVGGLVGRLWVGECGCVGIPALAMYFGPLVLHRTCLLYTSDAADE